MKNTPVRNFPKEVLTEAIEASAGVETVDVGRDAGLRTAAIRTDADHPLLVAQRILASLDGDEVEANRCRLAARRRPEAGLDEGRTLAGTVNAVVVPATAGHRHSQLVGGGRDGVAVHVPTPHAQRSVDRPHDQRVRLGATRPATARRSAGAGGAAVLATLVPVASRVAELGAGRGAARAPEGAGGAAGNAGRAGLGRTAGARRAAVDATDVSGALLIAPLGARGGAVGAGVARVADRLRDAGLRRPVLDALAGGVGTPVRSTPLLGDVPGRARHARVHRDAVRDAVRAIPVIRDAGARRPGVAAASLVRHLTRRTGATRRRARGALGADGGGDARVLDRARVAAVGVEDAGAATVDAVRTAGVAADVAGAAGDWRAGSDRGLASGTAVTRDRLVGAGLPGAATDGDEGEHGGERNEATRVLHGGRSFPAYTRE